MSLHRESLIRDRSQYLCCRPEASHRHVLSGRIRFERGLLPIKTLSKRQCNFTCSFRNEFKEDQAIQRLGLNESLELNP